MFVNVDKNGVARGLFGGNDRGSSGGSVDSAGSGRRSKTSDGLVDINIDIGFVNNFPVQLATTTIIGGLYSLSN